MIAGSNEQGPQPSCTATVAARGSQCTHHRAGGGLQPEGVLIMCTHVSVLVGIPCTFELIPWCQFVVTAGLQFMFHLANPAAMTLNLSIWYGMA